MIKSTSRNELRKKIHRRLRRRLRGTAERPRLHVYRSLNNIYAQITDDQRSVTLVSASTLDKEVRQSIGKGGNVAAAQAVGKVIAERAQAAGIKKVVFDRGGYLYHGRVKALADAARAHHLEF